MIPSQLAALHPGAYFYLASPYSKWKAGIDDACVKVARIAGRLIAQGLPIFSPIAHSHTVCVASGLDPYAHDIWLPADAPMFAGARGMIIAPMDGWRESYGIGEEIKWCGRDRKPVFILDIETLELDPFTVLVHA